MIMHPRQTKLTGKQQRGVTLIEVLIALLVVSVGLLSSASLQLLSKRSNYDAAQRTTAAHLAQDLLERMRSNPDALIDYMNAAGLGSNPAASPPVNCNGSINCTPSELAAYDLWQWEQQLAGELEQLNGSGTGGLVNPTVCIAGPGFGATGVYEIAIAWRGLTETSNPQINDCGAGGYGTGDRYRRVMVMRTFINAG